MSNSEDGAPQDGQCHRCGETARLRAADQNGIFRDICKSCFKKHHGLEA